VTVRALADAWNKFFFAPQSPIPISLFRILYGSLIVATLILLSPDWLTWYGVHAWVSLPTMLKLAQGARINLFTVMPQSDAWAEGLFWVFLASAVSLTIGFVSRISSVVVFVCLTSIHQRNLYIIHSGDTFMRAAGFFLMFAPAGAALSVDRLIRVRTGKEEPEIRPRAPWAQRMIQFEMALVYFITFCWKSTGGGWIKGDALYYITKLEEFRRFPVPSWMQHPLLLKLGTWLTLAVEFSLGVLVWFKDLRYIVLAFGVVFHLTIEYSLNVPLFEWEIMSAYVLFVDADDLMRAGRWIREHTARWQVARVRR
jgi:hypothetical protein